MRPPMGSTWEHGFGKGARAVLSWLSGRDPTLLADEPSTRALWPWALAHNLAVAAGLCDSFDRGHDFGVDVGWSDCAKYGGGSIESLGETSTWEPGCGRPAP